MKASEISCALCTQGKTGIFRTLRGDALSRLNSERTSHHYQAGQTLFYEGAAPLAIYCLHNGLVKLTKASPSGRSFVIRLLGKGEIVGFRAVIVRERYAATAEVVEPADVCIIPAETFHHLLEESPELKNALIEKLATELRVSEERMLDQAVLPARVRIARLLVFLADHSAVEGSPLTIQTNLQRQDLAEVVGITPETLSRILHQLNTEGIVRSSRSRLVITSRSRLAAIAARIQ